jgi:hypothetical protein
MSYELIQSSYNNRIHTIIHVRDDLKGGVDAGSFGE